MDGKYRHTNYYQHRLKQLVWPKNNSVYCLNFVEKIIDKIRITIIKLADKLKSHDKH